MKLGILPVLAVLFLGAALPARAEPLPDAIQAVVGVRSVVPASARTARPLGTERQGSGVVIDEDGLVLTIGYLIVEAERVEVRARGRWRAATVVAYDHETGFGLLRAAARLPIDPITLGESALLESGAPVLVASSGERRRVSAALVTSRDPFAGAWEYLLEQAIYTAPVHPGYGGAALIGPGGRLLGIGSLMVSNARVEGEEVSGNVFVPIDLLKPILDDLVTRGRRDGPSTPWLGLRLAGIHGRLVVIGVSADGPAKAAGLAPGDVVIGVGGRRVGTLAEFMRRVHGTGRAGTEVVLDMVRQIGTHGSLDVEKVRVTSMDRHDRLHLGHLK